MSRFLVSEIQALRLLKYCHEAAYSAKQISILVLACGYLLPVQSCWSVLSDLCRAIHIRFQAQCVSPIHLIVLGAFRLLVRRLLALQSDVRSKYSESSGSV